MNTISNMIPKHLVSFLMFCATSLASAREHNIRKRCLSWVRTPKTDGIKSVWADRRLCSDAIPQIYIIIEGRNPTGAGISPLDFHCR